MNIVSIMHKRGLFFSLIIILPQNVCFLKILIKLKWGRGKKPNIFYKKYEKSEEKRAVNKHFFTFHLYFRLFAFFSIYTDT